jgi:hypothetical protein
MISTMISLAVGCSFQNKNSKKSSPGQATSSSEAMPASQSVYKEPDAENIFEGGAAGPGTTTETGGEEEDKPGRSAPTVSCKRTVVAQVVALDQSYSYNRYGSYNPVGMVYALRRDIVSIDGSPNLTPGNVRLRDGKRPRPLTLRANKGDCLRVAFTNLLAPERALIPKVPSTPYKALLNDHRNDSPATRSASFHVNGLQYQTIGSDGSFVGKNASSLVAPGQSQTYSFYADKEGTFLLYSMGAVIGGEGNGGSLVQGLFGAINVEPEGSSWYRSQISAEDLIAARKKAPDGSLMSNADGTPVLNYEATYPNGVPVLKMLNSANEIVHSDLNAIISGYASTTETGTPSSLDENHFREITVIYHDELKTVQAFAELETRRDLAGVRDGFGVNYGAAGLGAGLLANRKKIGPTRNCVECKYEEFFLESWAGGDPALNVENDEAGRAVKALFPDDPSNVAHSYLGDPIRFRNLHAGPKETHVFHLHGHQWLYSPNNHQSNYLDSQTIGPGSAFTYDINYGGGGNRNLTPGDAIYHCHLYPHFAQGMWALWRNHDVFESGTVDRNLPDGEITGGTPNPAVVPIPGRGMPPMPTYNATQVRLADGSMATREAMPGYPFYISAIPGHRPPQAPLDIEHDGGLPRHVVTSIPNEAGATVYKRRGEFDAEIHKANIKLLPHDGTPSEQSAMRFHSGQMPNGVRTVTAYNWPAAAYPAFTSEGKPSRFIVNGQTPKPGAPFSEPCLPGSPERNYRASYVQTKIQVNKYGWHDPQGRIIVLNEDVEATLNGTRPPEPFFFRAQSGECINFYATNLIPDALEADDFQLYTPTDTIGQHIHLVKFDLMASDGAGNGWNYEDGTFAAQEVVARIEAANAMGGAFAADGKLDETGSRVMLTAKSHPLIPRAPVGAQTTVQRWWADPLLDGSGKDRSIDTVFTHDHFGPSSHQQHGFYGALVIEPKGSTWKDPVTGVVMGTRMDGGPTSWRANIITSDPSLSFREFNLAFADFVLAYDSSGQAINPPTLMPAQLPLVVEHQEGVKSPEAIAVSDPGTGTINYRNEPIPLRIANRGSSRSWTQKEGEEGDMSNVFSSTIHGDPSTPLLQGYVGDAVKIRLIQGAHEEQHVFNLTGHRWLREGADADSGFIASQPIGISEHFDFFLANGLPFVKNPKGTADFMYSGASTDDLWNGMWGLMRTYDQKQAALLELPNNPRPVEPTSVKDMSNCPQGAPIRSYNVVAITANGNLPENKLFYNKKYDLWDPAAILYVRKEHLPEMTLGLRRPEPLIIRANAGDCIRVNLTNNLPEVMPKFDHWNYLPPITSGFNINQVRSSNRASLHPQLVTFDVNRDHGANIGYNLLHAVNPGQSKTYTWYAGDYNIGAVGKARLIATPVEYGVIPLRDMADVVNHGMHGAVGALIIEPKGATWETDPLQEASATVSYTDAAGQKKSFREFVLIFQDELALHSRNRAFLEIPTPDEEEAEDEPVIPRLPGSTVLRNLGGGDDAEDSGHKAFNYRTEPFFARLGLPAGVDYNTMNDAELSSILSSAKYGDPETPLFTAKAGTQIRFRVTQGSGHARQHAFTLSGAEWQTNAFQQGSNSSIIGSNAKTPIISTIGGISASVSYNIVPLYGAGGAFMMPGDYLYRDQLMDTFGGGLWGIFRVIP